MFLAGRIIPVATYSGRTSMAAACS